MIVHIKGRSNSGKTALIEGLCQNLSRVGMRSGVIKHAMSPIDLKGKDSYRYREAGASTILLIGQGENVLIFADPLDLEEGIELMRSHVDLIIVESFSERRVGDVEIDLDAMSIEWRGETRAMEKGQEVYSVLQLLQEVGEMEREKFLLYVDGKKTHTNPFVTSIMHRVVRGMVSSLHGCEHIDDPEVKIEIRVETGERRGKDKRQT
jgi:molybdopterin-guanine dinucleotide biosynthesis protein MobB